MSPLGKLAVGAAGVVAIIVLFLVLRPDDEETASPSPAATNQATAGNTTGEAPTTTEEEPDGPSGPRVVRLNVRADEPEIERIDVERDERVVLVVRADIADYVHLHGYNIMGDVAPGQPARIEFRATVPGQFEVELEDRGQQIAQLTVQ